MTNQFEVNARLIRARALWKEPRVGGVGLVGEKEVMMIPAWGARGGEAGRERKAGGAMKNEGGVWDGGGVWWKTRNWNSLPNFERRAPPAEGKHAQRSTSPRSRVVEGGGGEAVLQFSASLCTALLQLVHPGTVLWVCTAGHRPTPWHFINKTNEYNNK